MQDPAFNYEIMINDPVRLLILESIKKITSDPVEVRRNSAVIHYSRIPEIVSVICPFGEDQFQIASAAHAFPAISTRMGTIPVHYDTYHNRAIHDMSFDSLAKEIAFQIDKRCLDLMEDSACFRRHCPMEIILDNDTNRRYFLEGYLEDTLFEVISRVIQQSSYPSTFMVTGDAIARMLRHSNHFMDSSITEGPPSRSEGYIRHFGNLGNCTVYSSPLRTNGTTLIGSLSPHSCRQGDRSFDCGFVYAPYLPLSSVPVSIPANAWMEISSLRPRGIESRYGAVVVNPNFYATLHFDVRNSEELLSVPSTKPPYYPKPTKIEYKRKLKVIRSNG